MVVATYIEDDETPALINHYAEPMRTSSTSALRELLRREIQQIERRATSEKRFKRIMEWLSPVPDHPVEEILRIITIGCRGWRTR